VIDDIAELIGGYRFSYTSEVQLHAHIAAVLTDARFGFEQEVTMASRDRINFLIDGVGIEVKIQGSYATVLAQLQRYAASPRVDALLLVTTIATHLAMPVQIGGKPLRVCSLLAASL